MLLALSIGGDDYICKPYSLGVLLAKVKAELKRYEESNASSNQDNNSEKASAKQDSDDGIVKLGNAVVNLKTASVKKAGPDGTPGTEQQLKAMEYKLLVYMLQNP